MYKNEISTLLQTQLQSISAVSYHIMETAEFPTSHFQFYHKLFLVNVQV